MGQDQLTVVLYEAEYASHNVLLDGVRCWLIHSEGIHLLLSDIVEAPACFVDVNTEWSVMLVVMVGYQLCESDDFSLACKCCRSRPTIR
jgi:hypothetical protein